MCLPCCLTCFAMKICAEGEVLGPLLTPFMSPEGPWCPGVSLRCGEVFYVGSPSTGLGVWHNCGKDFNLIPFFVFAVASPEPWAEGLAVVGLSLDCDRAAANFPSDGVEGSFLAGQPCQCGNDCLWLFLWPELTTGDGGRPQSWLQL